jgi:modulator of FtsH protease
MGVFMQNIFRGYQLGKRNVAVRNSLVKDTYLLLSLTIVFSAFVAGLSVFYNARPVSFFVSFPIMLVLLMVINQFKHSSFGLFLVFVFTGFFGYLAGPSINSVLSVYSNGVNIVSTSLAATGFIFMALSIYAHLSNQDFSFLGSFLFISFLVIIGGSLLAYFYQSHILSFFCSGAVMLLSCAWILYTTSRLKNSGETSYISATVELYLSVYNIFMVLLELFSMFSGTRR